MVSNLGMATIFIAFSLGSFFAGYLIGRYRGVIAMVSGLQNMVGDNLKNVLQNVKIEKQNGDENETPKI